MTKIPKATRDTRHQSLTGAPAYIGRGQRVIRDNLSEIEQMTCVSYTTAKNYSFAAQTLLSSKQYELASLQLILPTNMLVAHAIELYLKSVLYENGLSKHDVRTRYGHDLIKLHPAVEGFGVKLSTVFLAVMSLHAFGHSSDTEYAFRYPKPDDAFDLMRPGPLIENLQTVDLEFSAIIRPDRFLTETEPRG